MTKAVYKGYKYRIYPTKEQINLIDETFDACRYVYNRALEFCIDEYKNKGVSYSYYELSSMLTEWKNTDAMWLYQYEHRALQCSIKNLVSAYKHLFKDDAGFPKFKSRFYRQSYTTNTLHGLHVYFSRSRIKLPKIKGEIKAVLHRQFTGDIKSVTVSRTNSGKYYASFCVLEKHEVMSRGDDKLGIDVGIKDYAVMSDETRIENPEWQKKYEEKLAKLQRQLSRKQKGSGRYEKQRKKLASLYEHIAEKRKQFQHKETNKIIKRSKAVFTEHLMIRNMVKNKHLAKPIMDAAWYKFTRQLEYKCAWNGRIFRRVGRDFPSSQICSNCGYKNEKVKSLSVREWVCPECGAEHDRDVNAAMNILYEGARIVVEEYQKKKKMKAVYST